MFEKIKMSKSIVQDHPQGTGILSQDIQKIMPIGFLYFYLTTSKLVRLEIHEVIVHSSCKKNFLKSQEKTVKQLLS